MQDTSSQNCITSLNEMSPDQAKRRINRINEIISRGYNFNKKKKSLIENNFAPKAILLVKLKSKTLVDSIKFLRKK